MSITIDEIVSEALSLPPQLRALVAEKIIKSLNDSTESKGNLCERILLSMIH